jgi:ketosteroid isomerase-like protein
LITFSGEAMIAVTPSSSIDESDVLETYEEYLQASIDLDEKRVATYYHEPFVFVSAEKTVAVATRAEAEEYLKPGFESLRQSGYVKTGFPKLRAQSLGPGIEIVSGLGIRYRMDGTQLMSFGITYIWRQVPDGWKLAVMTVHDTTKVLPLDQGTQFKGCSADIS